jgi:hypothetical protein
MLVRQYTEADLDALRQIHQRQGFDYAFPDLTDPIFISKLVVEDDSGRAVMASLARLTCEVYLLADPQAGSPRDRFDWILQLHRAGERDLLPSSLDDAPARRPPPTAKLCRRLHETLAGVLDDAWTPHCRRLHES